MTKSVDLHSTQYSCACSVHDAVMLSRDTADKVDCMQEVIDTPPPPAITGWVSKAGEQGIDVGFKGETEG